MTDRGQDTPTPGTPVESEDRPPPEAQRQPDPGLSAVGARRAGLGPAWLRSILALPAFVVVSNLAALPVVLAGGLSAPGTAVLLAASVAAAAACIALVLATWRVTSGAPLRALGLGGAQGVARRFAVGALGGFVLMAFVVGGGLLFGAWEIRPGLPRPLPLVAATAVLLLASFWEELGFRGVILQEAGRHRLGLGMAWSAVAFTVMHLANPGALGTAAARVLVPTNIALAALVLGGTFLLAGDLWCPWGVHFGWNWAQACVFGLPVSGFELPSAWHGSVGDGPAWLTGAAFGPEASAIATVVLAATCAGLALLIRRRRPVLPLVSFDRGSSAQAGAPVGPARS